jgi:beta-mannanase
MIKLAQNLHDIANKLEDLGLYKESEILTDILIKIAQKPYEFAEVSLYQKKIKIFVRNAGQDHKPYPGIFETFEEAIEKANKLAYDVTVIRPEDKPKPQEQLKFRF